MLNNYKLPKEEIDRITEYLEKHSCYYPFEWINNYNHLTKMKKRVPISRKTKKEYYAIFKFAKKQCESLLSQYPDHENCDDWKEGITQLNRILNQNKLKNILLDQAISKFIKAKQQPKTTLKSFVFGEENDDYAYEDYDCELYEEEPSCCSEVNLDHLDDLIDKLKKATFTEELIRLIAKSGKKDSEIYKAADIDKRLFSKIMSDKEYKPSKDTAIALSLSLKLSFDEMTDLLSRAGYTLSHSNKRDLIIEYFFQRKKYSVIDLNDTLYRFGEKTLGRTK